MSRPTEILIHLVVTVVPSCYQIPFLATLYSCLSDRKSFSENTFVCLYKLYRNLATLCPSLLKVFSLLSLFLLKAFMTIRPIVSLDTTFLKCNETKLPFVQKAYDPLQKKGSIGQVLAIACFHAFGFCFPLGFCIIEGGRTEAILSLLSSLSLPDMLTLLVDGGLMNQRLVERVKKNKAEWELIGLIRRDMIVSYRVRRGRVEEVVDKARLVYVRSWESKVKCVPFRRKNGRVYYLACTDTKLSAEKVDNGYKKGGRDRVSDKCYEAREGIVKEDSSQRRGIDELVGDEYDRIFDVGRKDWEVSL